MSKKRNLPILLSEEVRDRIQKIITIPISDYKTMSGFILEAIEEKLQREESDWLEIDKKYKVLQDRKK